MIKGSNIQVLYCEKRNAKLVKTRLEELGLIDTTYRMTSADDDEFLQSKLHEPPMKDLRSLSLQSDIISSRDCIAVPINQECMNAMLKESRIEKHDDWSNYVVRYGRQICPFKPSILGNSSTNSNIRLSNDMHESFIDLSSTSTETIYNIEYDKYTLIQKILIQTITLYHRQNNSSTTWDKEKSSRLKENIYSLSNDSCPRKLELLGDDRTLVIPRKAFRLDIDHTFRNILEFLHTEACSKQILCHNKMLEKERYFMDKFWENLAVAHGSKRVVRRGEIDPNSKIRQSGHSILWLHHKEHNHPDHDVEVSVNTYDGPHLSPGWITITEQRIKQSFDLTKVMFSRGNISEKIRFGKLVRKDEMVLDMYAGNFFKLIIQTYIC